MVMPSPLYRRRADCRPRDYNGGTLLTERHKEITDKIWEIANRLRGPYRPPQYRLVMLPMVVLRRRLSDDLFYWVLAVSAACFRFTVPHSQFHIDCG
jgi:hypothetical protein